MKDVIIGAQLYSVRTLCQDPATFKDTLTKLKGFGYNTCQLSGQSREMPDEVVRDILQETGMQCVVTHNSMKDFGEDFEATIKRHHTWNCKYVGLGAMPDDYRTGLEGYKRFAQFANEVGEKLADAGLTFVYHNHAFEFQKYDGVTGMDVLFDSFSDKVQFELDAYWVHAGGANAAKWIRKVDGRMDVAHIKDMMGITGGKSHCTMVPIGSGNFDWLELKSAFEETKVKFVEIEQDNAVEAADPLGEMHASLKYMKSLGYNF